MTDGRTKASADGTNASFVSDLRVVGGTGKYASVTGGGLFTGERQAALGGAVAARFHLDLQT
jgi:hypothetical protein